MSCHLSSNFQSCFFLAFKQTSCNKATLLLARSRHCLETHGRSPAFSFPNSCISLFFPRTSGLCLVLGCVPPTWELVEMGVAESQQNPLNLLTSEGLHSPGLYLTPKHFDITESGMSVTLTRSQGGTCPLLVHSVPGKHVSVALCTWSQGGTCPLPCVLCLLSLSLPPVSHSAGSPPVFGDVWTCAPLCMDSSLLAYC